MSEAGKGDKSSPMQAMLGRIQTRSQMALFKLDLPQAIQRIAQLVPGQWQELLDICRASAEFSSAVLLQMDADDPVLHVMAALRLDELAPGKRVGQGDGMFARAIQTSAHVHLRAPLNLLGRASGIQELAVLRVTDGDRLVALIGLTAPSASELRSLDTLLTLLPLITQWLRQEDASRASQQRIERLQLLARMARLLAESLELDALLQNAADAIHEVLHYANVDIPLLDPNDPETLVVRIRGGDYKQRIVREDRLSIQTGIMGSAVRERRIQWVNDLRLDPRYVQPPVPTRMRAELAVPIIWHDSVLGVLNIESPKPLSQDDVDLLQAVADDLASAICNARLFAQVQQLAEETERSRMARQFPEAVSPLLASLRVQLKHGYTVIRSQPGETETSLTRANELLHQVENELTRWQQQLLSKHQANSPSDLIKLQGLPVALARMVRAMIPGDIGFSCQAGSYQAQSLMHEDLLLRLVPQQVALWLKSAGLVRLQIEVELREASLHVVLSTRWLSQPPTTDVKAMRKRLASIGGELDIHPGPEPLIAIWNAEVPRRDRI